MKIGYVLSGGASRCIAHLGIIKALDEMGVKPAVISAVSGGALFGVGIAAGISPEESLEKVVKLGSIRWFYPSTKAGGLFTMSRIEAMLKEQLIPRKFEELTIPMVVNASDIMRGEPIYFSEGELIPAIIASSSYPAIFEPVEYAGYTLLDGGILNNFPVEPIRERVDKVIGMSTGSTFSIEKVGSVQQIFTRTLGMAITEHDKARFPLADIVLEPPGLEKYGMFDSGEGKDIFDIGYRYAHDQSKAIEALLGS